MKITTTSKHVIDKDSGEVSEGQSVRAWGKRGARKVSFSVSSDEGSVDETTIRALETTCRTFLDNKQISFLSKLKAGPKNEVDKKEVQVT